MKRLIAAVLCALAFVSGVAFAYDGDTLAQYSSHTAEGDSAHWGI